MMNQTKHACLLPAAALALLTHQAADAGEIVGQDVDTPNPGNGERGVAASCGKRADATQAIRRGGVVAKR